MTFVRPKHARDGSWREEDCGWCGALAGEGCGPECPWPDPPFKPVRKCSSCGCPAATSRDGQAVCWRCADPVLDGQPCERCGGAGRPATPDPVFNAAWDQAGEVIERRRRAEQMARLW